mmetsp:Transcript_24316/g.61373  ORF Transcript_24316/g.61373 Transcript_24316/m.61373 type:complete len:124 (-) Transcript_24316:2889-3260(-)
MHCLKYRKLYEGNRVPENSTSKKAHLALAQFRSDVLVAHPSLYKPMLDEEMTIIDSQSGQTTTGRGTIRGWMLYLYSLRKGASPPSKDDGHEKPVLAIPLSSLDVSIAAVGKRQGWNAEETGR